MNAPSPLYLFQGGGQSAAELSVIHQSAPHPGTHLFTYTFIHPTNHASCKHSDHRREEIHNNT